VRERERDEMKQKIKSPNILKTTRNADWSGTNFQHAKGKFYIACNQGLTMRMEGHYKSRETKSACETTEF
jgi:hypothetical protein